MNRTSLFSPPGSQELQEERVVFRHVLTDRKSKYTVSGGRVTARSHVKPWIKAFLRDKQFQKATHNSYAWRIVQDDGSVDEGWNDDGEKGAGNCILRELKRGHMVNAVVVVSRYYGGIHLHADRFRNVIEVTKVFLERVNEKRI